MQFLALEKQHTPNCPKDMVLNRTTNNVGYETYKSMEGNSVEQKAKICESPKLWADMMDDDEDHISYIYQPAQEDHFGQNNNNLEEPFWPDKDKESTERQVLDRVQTKRENDKECKAEKFLKPLEIITQGMDDKLAMDDKEATGGEAFGAGVMDSPGGCN